MSKHFFSGMRGAYAVAAELSRLEFIVSPTSRSAKGADLLVTDANCQRPSASRSSSIDEDSSG